MRYLYHSGRQLLATVSKKASRKLLRAALFMSTEKKRTRAERWLRGREQFKKLQAADVVVVSFGKSGRTWLRVMLSRVYQLQHHLSARHILGFDNLHYRNRAIPKIFFTHDNYVKDYTGHSDSKADFYAKRVVLLVRDPRDVAVSQFFQWKFRMKPEKKVLNEYPTQNQDVPIFDFVMDPGAGLPKIMDFMNLWAEEIPHLKRFLLVRYEDLKTDPHQTLKDVLDFMDTPATDEQIAEAVDFASYDNMKQMEQQRTFWLSGGRLVPKDRNNPDSYKVRRAKVGGYRDYFRDDELERINTMVDETLAPVFGYRTEAEKSAAPAQTRRTAKAGIREAG